MINEMIKMELAELKQDLKKGDTIVEEVAINGDIIKHSKKVGDARIKFINLIKGLNLTASDMTKAINLFGRKTTHLYWIK
jgi:hypothetical protein